VSNGEESRVPWKWTDDIVCLSIVLVWLVGKALSAIGYGFEVPDWAASAAFAYAFGKSTPRGGEA